VSKSLKKVRLVMWLDCENGSYNNVEFIWNNILVRGMSPAIYITK
jgi:hypothetical protein